MAYEAWIAFETAYVASGKKVDHVRDEREKRSFCCVRADLACERTCHGYTVAPLGRQEVRWMRAQELFT